MLSFSANRSRSRSTDDVEASTPDLEAMAEEIRKRSSYLLRVVELDPDIESLLLAGRQRLLRLRRESDAIHL